MPLPTVLRSFDNNLPKIRRVPFTPKYRIFTFSESYMDSIEPITRYLHQDIKVLADLAKSTLENPDVASVLSRTPIGSVDKTILLKTEADVSRATAQYLVYPVNIALLQSLPQGAILRSFAESPLKKSRFDFQWTLEYKGKNYKLAILELKNTNVIRLADFKGGKAMSSEHAEELLYKMYERNQDSLLRKNAKGISMQAMQYSQHCDDVAVFDWDSMLLFDFSDSDVGSDRNPVSMAQFSTKRHSKPREKGVNFRLILLGFLRRALERHVKIESERPGDPKAHRPKNYGLFGRSQYESEYDSDEQSDLEERG